MLLITYRGSKVEEKKSTVKFKQIVIQKYQTFFTVSQQIELAMSVKSSKSKRVF